MGRIEVKELRYIGDKYYYKNDKFKNGLNILVGDNGNGKSTFTYLLVYGLGLNVSWFSETTKQPLKEILSDTNNYVELKLEINKELYILKRKIKENIISVYSEKDKEIKSFSIGRNGYFFEKEQKNFSDWMFEKLKINLVEITQYDSTYRINFDDLMRYMYYDQITDNNTIISEFGINKDSKYKNNNVMRRSIFELIMSSYFKEYYDTYYHIKKISNDLQEKKEYVKSLMTVKENIIAKSDYSEEINLNDEKQKINKELFRLKDILNKSSTDSLESEEDDVAVNCLIEIQKRIVIKVHKLKEYEFLIDDIEKKLMQFENLYIKKQQEIERLDKILFTANYIDIINEDRCPFCQEKLDIEEGHCLCGSEKSINFSRFIYSDKEYEEMMKSKVKSIKTIASTVNSYKVKYNEIKLKIDNTKSELEELNNKLKSLMNESLENSSTEIIDELMERYAKLKEKSTEIELILEKENEINKAQVKVANLKKEIKESKDKLNELEVEKDDILQENLEKFEGVYSKYLKDYDDKDDSFEVKLDRNYVPFLNVYREQSFSVPKKFFYYLALLDMSINTEVNINYPRFLIIDTLKDAGLELDDLVKLMRKLKRYENQECQIILTCGYDEYSREFKEYEIDYLSDSNMLLKKRG